jgi:predicted membrane-bound mannosyltransferase
MLAYFRGPSGSLWSEGVILLFASIGIYAAAARREVPGVDRALLQFIAIYTLVLLVAYSSIPYKTPWSMLGALQGLVLLAGAGAVAALDAARGRALAGALCGVLLIGGAYLGFQSYRATNAYEADPDNPYVYAHPGDDVIRIAARVQAYADVHPDGNGLHIEVVSPASDYWPLPWYLRAFPNTGWWETVDPEAPAAPLILAAPAVEEALLRKLYEVPPPGERYLYVPLFDTYREIRPNVEMRGYVLKELRDAFERVGDPDVGGALVESRR